MSREAKSLKLCCRGCGALFTDRKDNDRKVIDCYLDALLDALQQQSADWRRKYGKQARDVKLNKVKELALSSSVPCERQFRCPLCFMPSYDTNSAYSDEPTHLVLTIGYWLADEDLEEEESLVIHVRPEGTFERPFDYLQARFARLAEVFQALSAPYFFEPKKCVQAIADAIESQQVPKSRHWNYGWSCDLYATCCAGLLSLELSERLREQIRALDTRLDLDRMTDEDHEEFCQEEDQDSSSSVLPIPSAAPEIHTGLLKELNVPKLASSVLKLRNRIAKKRTGLKLDERQLSTIMTELDHRRRKK